MEDRIVERTAIDDEMIAGLMGLFGNQPSIISYLDIFARRRSKSASIQKHA